MSWDVYLKNTDGKVVSVEKFEEGGTYLVGGSTEANLNITYNYSWFYYKCLDKKKGLKWLSGKTSIGCIDRLQAAVNELGTNRWKDYWTPTPGNAGYALSILLEWAKDNPDAIFEVN